MQLFGYQLVQGDGERTRCNAVASCDDWVESIEDCGKYKTKTFKV